MSVLIIGALLGFLVVLSLPTLRHLTRMLRELSTLADRSAGDIVKTIDLPDPSSSR